MSIKRYNSVGLMGWGNGTHEDSNGEYVKYDDYEKLKSELDNLNYHIKNTFLSSKGQINMIEENKKLKADIDELKKLQEKRNSSNMETLQKNGMLNAPIAVELYCNMYYDSKTEVDELKKELNRINDENTTLRIERMQDKDGKRITYSDYSKLKNEVESLSENKSILLAKNIQLNEEVSRLKSENERLKIHKYTPDEINSLLAQIKNLQACFNLDLLNNVIEQNNRLRKAGNEMLGDYMTTGVIFPPSQDAWRSASNLNQNNTTE